MHTRDEILDFLRTHRDFLKENFHITKIGLFGSFVRGDQTAQSDIDLLIELDAEVGDVHLLKNSVREYLTSKLNRGIHLAREKYLHDYAKEVILKEAIFI